MRGDEPEELVPPGTGLSEFPTCVGMNRERHFDPLPSPRVPHMRGDEPARHRGRGVDGGSSPHAWG